MIRLSIAALFFAMTSFAQQVKISLLAHDEHTGELIRSYSVTAGNTLAAADSSGKCVVTAAAGQALILQTRHPNYKPLELSFIAKADSPVVFFMRKKVIELDEVTINAGKENRFGIGRMNNVDGTNIYAGKKSELVYVQDLPGNLAANNSRQIYAKVAGINVFENDGSGATVGIGGRGLNPNRISNFNTRQNGYDISADALGYPESYYVPPSEALGRIEILRGAAGLQFGTQFGGMINYRFAEPSSRPIAADFRQTAGSFGFFNSFNRLSGSSANVSYQAFYNYKTYHGWRARSELESHNAFASATFRISDKLSVTSEFTHLNYLAQQPGGLTDKQFAADPGMVTRFRNWFRVNWNLGAVTVNYRPDHRTRMSINAFGLAASRDALGNLGRPDRRDDTSAFRNLLRDDYRNFGMEARIIRRYSFAGAQSNFLIGTRYYQGHTHRQQGSASKTFDADFRFIHLAGPDNSDYEFPSRNIAVFAENVFQIGKRLSVTPGLRAEHISTASDGYYKLTHRDLAGDTLLDLQIYDNRKLSRSFLIGGIGIQFKACEGVELYMNFSQNYRSINFNDMRVVNANFQVDPNLSDERGSTTDGGVRGSIRDVLYYDAGLFFVNYANRIGTTLRVDSATFQVVRYRTNIGSSQSAGAEAFAEIDWLKLSNASSRHRLSTFVNYSYVNAIYTTSQPEYQDKRVEYAPQDIVRGGVTWSYRGIALSVQNSFTSEQYSEATNAPASASGIYGIIPAYQVLDFSAAYTWKKFSVSAGINNVRNAVYFTRRAEGYPGPGILPADPRNGYVTLRVQL